MKYEKINFDQIIFYEFKINNEDVVRRIFMNIGIDKISFFVPQYYIDMTDLAHARGEEPAKFKIGLGQDEMAVTPITQDPVTLAANAALQMLSVQDRKEIDFIMFATETGIDQSKAAGVYIQGLLNINNNVRVIELKHACYSATAALQLAKGHIALNPSSKVLILASDVSKYGLNTPGEVTQGAGAVAMLISANPKILTIDESSSFYTEDIMDFWRPNYSPYAFVDGKYSNDKYIQFFNEVWNKYKQDTESNLDKFAAICFHLPYTKMGIKALQTVLEQEDSYVKERLTKNYEKSTLYNRRVGNVYTASLYLSFISLIENSSSLKGNDQIGFFSYGSGAVGEFFTGTLQNNFKDQLFIDDHESLLNNREQLDIEQYETMYNETLPSDGSTKQVDILKDPANICVQGIKDHKRQYVNKHKQ